MEIERSDVKLYYGEAVMFPRVDGHFVQYSDHLAALAREREAALEECRKQAVRILNEPFHPIGLSGLELFIAWIEEAKKAVGVNQAAG